MANEITVTVGLAHNVQGIVYPLTAKTITQTGTNRVSGTATVGTSESSISISGVGTAGVAMLKNLSSTATVQIGYETGAYFSKLPAGAAEPVYLDPSVTTLYVKASAANTDLLYDVNEA